MAASGTPGRTTHGTGHDAPRRSDGSTVVAKGSDLNSLNRSGRVIPAPCRDLLDQIADAYADEDVPRLVLLYDESALICSAAEPDVVVSRDELFERSDVLQRTHLVGAIDRIPIDADAGLLRATGRTTADGRYQPAAEHVWLLTFRDNLVYRQRVLGSRADAIAFYARHGVDLGMPQADVQLV